MQDGRDMGEFGADEEKDGFWMRSIGLDEELVVQMEDDMDKDVGRLSPVRTGLHVAEQKTQHLIAVS